VKGGGGEVVARKAGKEQHDYLIVKMTDVLVTGVSHTGNADGPSRARESDWSSSAPGDERASRRGSTRFL
jgi:hypothetical protein